MGIRKLRTMGDDCLRKNCKEIKMITPRIRLLAGDMLDTMYEANGVGLAAPQVGILKRMVVIDVDGEHPYVLINPEILETRGEQTGYEGCLSVPGKSGIVTRPNYAKVRAMGLDGKEFILEGEELLARAICHECDHLDGVIYVDKVEGELIDNEELEHQMEEEAINENE
ncbi:MAG: peptide deformylase [Clostridiales bacterium]|nr:peptide deformylase [Clostridiales bacterium]